MGIVESFTDKYIEKDEINGEELSNKSLALYTIIVILIKLFCIYLVMLLWPRVMPKLFPSIVKKPKYISLIGLSLILALL